MTTAEPCEISSAAKNCRDLEDRCLGYDISTRLICSAVIELLRRIIGTTLWAVGVLFTAAGEFLKFLIPLITDAGQASVTICCVGRKNSQRQYSNSGNKIN